MTEEVSGIDLVREQFRLADGEALGYDDPPLRGHSIEFRINGEDPGRGFLPAPGRLTTWRPPSGPGVRIDSGVEQGSSVPQAFDSLLAKLIVTGANRSQALERARRALAEFEIDGMATALPFHRAVVDDPAFAPADPAEPFTVHTRWIETEFTNTIAPYTPDTAVGDADSGQHRQTITVEVAGKRLEVSLPADLARSPASGVTPRRRRASGSAAATHAPETLNAPMQGTIVKVAVVDGQLVESGDLIVVLEAMKMEQPLTAHRAGTVAELAVEAGQIVPGGAVICVIRD